MKMIHYPNKVRSHLVTIVSLAAFTPKSTSKLRSAQPFRYSIYSSRASFLALILLNLNNHYKHGLHNILTTTTVFTVIVPASAHTIP